MGLFDFVKDAGEKIFGGGSKAVPVPPEPVAGDQAGLDQAMSAALTSLVQNSPIGSKDLQVQFEDGKATLKGQVSSQADCEKLVLLVGNTRGVSAVADHLKIDKSLAPPGQTGEPEQKTVFYTVKSGDTLSKIAREHYGNAGKYTVIFDANKPMLDNPDRIYPGQTLRIPQL